MNKRFFKSPEFLVWLGFGLSAAALLSYALLYSLTAAGTVAGMSGGVTALCWLTVVGGLPGLALSVWCMMRWALFDTPKWLHIASVAISVVNILFPVPSSTFLLVSSMVGKENVEVKLPSESDKEIKPDIVISIDSRKGVLTGEVKNDSVKIDALKLSLTDLGYEGKLGKWASRIPEKAKVTFEADEKAKFDEVQKTMDALSTAGVKFRMSAKE